MKKAETISKSIPTRPKASAMILPLLVLGYLWFVLINQLRVEWTLNPQYNYGWAVPFLCLYLLWRRIQKSKAKSPARVSCFADRLLDLPSSLFYFLFVLPALLYLPTRLIEEANPDWRLVSWALALEVVGLTLIFVRFALNASTFSLNQSEGGDKISSPSARFRISDFVFPIGFFLVAVPWPTVIEGPLIQGLTRVDARATVELLGWLGIPAMPHGNVIEVATGVVGIDEACSGIRSFQATLMISLFLGELYQLNAARRWGLVLGGFAMSFLFNLTRMSLLVWVAARKGVAAIASWHDPAGVTILVACFFCLWGLGVWLAKSKSNIRKQEAEIQPSIVPSRAAGFRSSPRELQFLSLALLGWLVLSNLGVGIWYHSHESRLPVAVQWTVAFPTNNPTFKELPLPERTRQILRYNEGRSAAWQEGDVSWQAVFLRWNPGRTALHLAQNHTPEVCLTAAGHQLTSVSPLEWFEVRGLRMPFLSYEVTDAPRPVFVFYCLWDDRAGTQGFGTMSLTYGNRLAPVLAGLRNPGQRSLEIAVTGVNDASAAETALRHELGKLIATN